MGYRSQARPRSECGFSIVELVVVVGLIVTLAAIALPSIGQYMRNYRINGALRNVSGELQTARAQAVSKNTRTGVSFVIVGPTTYRFVREDVAPGVAGRLGPLLDLPLRVTFQPGNVISMRFSNLGASCVPGTPNCAAVAGALCDPVEIAAARCSDAPAPFIATPPGQEPQINLLEIETGLTRQARIGAGGRVFTDLQ